MRRTRASLCVLGLTLASATLVFPQGADKGAIQGTVADESGAVVP